VGDRILFAFAADPFLFDRVAIGQKVGDVVRVGVPV
jgi:hypothetical protein